MPFGLPPESAFTFTGIPKFREPERGEGGNRPTTKYISTFAQFGGGRHAHGFLQSVNDINSSLISRNL
jgi:hypothetical protein